MDIHIFQDPIWHYTTATCKRINSLNYKNEFEITFVNITNEPDKNKSDLIIHLPEDWRSIKRYLVSLDKIKNVYFHNYNYVSQHILIFIKNTSKNIIFNWVFWSAEFYNLPEISSKNYIGRSYKYHPTHNFFRLIKFHLFHFKERLFDRPYYSHQQFIRSFNEIKFFLSFLRSDYENVVKYSNAKLEYKLFSYLSFEQFLKESDKSEKIIEQKSEISIMINHNGDPILNHFDVLDRLISLNTKFKIVLPLAYGNYKYINYVKQYCLKNFDVNKIEFWDKFLSPSEYSEKLLSINVAIFNISVQKGIGNILPLLWNGTKVYLREESPIYIDFTKLGFRIFSIQNDLTEESISKSLSLQEVSLNRKLLSDLLSEKSVNNYYKDCFLDY